MAGVTTKAARQPARDAGRRFAGRRFAPRPAALALGGLLAAGAAGLLFLAYLRLSWTVPVTADGAAQALQARDMLAGNWRLHGWTVSDVSFYTTELPEYVLVELLRPFGAGVIHVAAAVGYTLLVLGAFALARGSARRPEGLVRGALAAVIMLAPQPGYGSFVLLLSPDHTGTQVPLLLGWLLLDRAWSPAGPPSRARRWLVPAALCLLLAWVQFADRIALLTAVVPLLIVCTARTARAGRTGGTVRAGRSAPASFAPIGALARLPISSGGAKYDKADGKVVITDRKSAGVVITDRKWGRRLAGRPETSLALAAVASVGVAWAAARLLAAAGGFTAHPLPFRLAPLSLLWTHTWLTGWGILEVYGANFLGVTGAAGITFAALHLAGLALAVAGTGIALARLLRRRRPIRANASPVSTGSASTVPANAGPVSTGSASTVPANAGPVTTGSASTVPAGSRLVNTALADDGPADRGAAGLVDSVLAVAIVANLVSYLVSIEPGTVTGTGYDAREIAAVLPLGAVLAGRLLGPELTRLARRCRGHREFGGLTGRDRTRSESPWVAARPPQRAALLPAPSPRLPAGLLALLLAVPLAGYPAALGYAAAQPAAYGRDQVLADWLVAHGLRYGLGGAAANAVTTDSGARAVVASTVVRQGRVRPLLYQSQAAAYDARKHDATFLVAGTPAGPGDPAEDVPAAAVRATFGPPSRIYWFSGFTVDVWDVNLLTRLGSATGFRPHQDEPRPGQRAGSGGNGSAASRTR